MVYYNFSLFQSTIYLEENIEIITFFCYTAIVYIYAIQEVNVYLYIAVGKNFEKNSLFVLTRSGYMESVADLQKPPFDKPVSFLRLFNAKTRALLIGAIQKVRENAMTTTA